MDELVPFFSREYFLWLGLLGFARGADFYSTWMASPNLVLEGNPISKTLRWKRAIPLNALVCLLLATWPLPALIVCTLSVLLAARHFHFAWVIRALGEENYKAWLVARWEETPVGLFLFCLLAHGLLTAGLGAALAAFSESRLVPLGIGIGIIAYALAVTFYTLHARWRNRRAAAAS